MIDPAYTSAVQTQVDVTAVSQQKASVAAAPSAGPPDTPDADSLLRVFGDQTSRAVSSSLTGLSAEDLVPATGLHSFTSVTKEMDAHEVDLHRERRDLVTRQVRGTATREELRRLEYLHWQLDRIEECRLARDVARLEAIVGAYERFGQQLQADLEKVGSTRRDRRREI